MLLPYSSGGSTGANPQEGLAINIFDLDGDTRDISPTYSGQQAALGFWRRLAEKLDLGVLRKPSVSFCFNMPPVSPHDDMPLCHFEMSFA